MSERVRKSQLATDRNSLALIVTCGAWCFTFPSLTSLTRSLGEAHELREKRVACAKEENDLVFGDRTPHYRPCGRLALELSFFKWHITTLREQIDMGRVGNEGMVTPSRISWPSYVGVRFGMLA